ncbi:glycoside-pentoside-hexuronide (GPH):cation symporter [Virgibacillus sp. NKC19-16]|uniref:glycoside-pentoside-hexuronide (GPH):cation symporter n=1 Tax=Virgibacillus salidurans TaxID=2831673 RepID=UPI001F41CA20|nr:glycoside-pentoside-hexuronide (GPH):cation symporter [Virgibacillus sp. NKC19-16]UJL46975.1 glycoside-pentoside-hexuronide (GPH):cation symporter [Virgibacillus sp. NKC19-16]
MENKIVEEEPVVKEHLGFKEKLSYGLGDTANNLTFSMITTYLLVFYTDVFGISAAAVATLFLVARIWDAINDPIMGSIVDRFGKNNKHGQFRPYMKWAGVPVVIMAVLVFITPDLSESGKLIYAYVTYILFGMAYTLINIPYGSLASVMTRDPVDRSSLASFRGLGSQIGVFSIGILVVPMVALFPSDQIGYPAVVGMFGVIALILYFLAYKNTKERIKPVKSANPEKMNLKMFTRILTNGPFLALSFMSFFILLAMLVNQSVGLYFFTYNLGNEFLFSVYNMLNIGSVVLLVIFIPKLTAKYGKKAITLAGLLIGAVAMGVLFILPTTPITALLFLWVGMLGISIPNMLVWAFISDVIDYGEWKTGVRQEGTTYSMYSFMRKLSQAIAGFAGATGLAIIGYVPNVVQTAETLIGIEVMMMLIPAIACIICFAIFKWGYKLNDKMFAQISADLEAKQ